ncbi:MAG: DUF2848 domain-containing protein [Sphingomonadales bacterium]|nr:DUF2848 domain-containing protein [Sphingomonadales bacterium]
MSAELNLTLVSGGEERTATVSVRHAIIAGWTGRDPVAVEKHIKELEELGVPRPASTPIYYRVAASRITTASQIQVTGTESSGETEFVLLKHDGRLWVGVGSDHTDRKVETYNITVSKQMCEKPMAHTFWTLDDVRDHWDRLELRSWTADGELYQEGSVAAMRMPDELMTQYAGKGLPDDAVMFCGTLAAIGGVRPSPQFSFELNDPVLGRKIAHAYEITELPVLG